MVPVICIDDKYRPFQIDTLEWLKKGDTYHITEIAACSINGITGVSLFEKPLTHEKHFPYVFFALRRFGIEEKNLGALKQLMENCNELSGFDVNRLVETAIEEQQLELV